MTIFPSPAITREQFLNRIIDGYTFKPKDVIYSKDCSNVLGILSVKTDLNG